MSDKYYAWLQAINQRDHSLLILSLAGLAIGLGWVMLDNMKLPDTAKKIAKWGYAVSCFSLYVFTILLGIANA